MRRDRIVARFSEALIRYGRERDLEDICELVRARSRERIQLGMKPTRVTKKLRCEWLKWLITSNHDPKDPTIVLVAEVNGKAVGLAMVKKSTELSENHAPWWIWVVGVHVNYRKRGLATALVNTIVEETRKCYDAKKLVYAHRLPTNALNAYIAVADSTWLKKLGKNACGKGRWLQTIKW